MAGPYDDTTDAINRALSGAQQPGAPAPVAPPSPHDDTSAAISNALANPTPPPGPTPKEDWPQLVSTGVINSVGQLGGLPHTIASAADRAFDLFASPRSAITDNPINPFGEPTPSTSEWGADWWKRSHGTQPQPMPPMMPPGEGFLTRHTLSPEEINKPLWTGISDINVATGGKPVEPYVPKTQAGRVVQAGAEQFIPSLVGPGEGWLARTVGGVGGGAASQAYAEAHPDDKVGQAIAGLVTAPLTSLGVGAAENFGRAFGNTMVGAYGSPQNQSLYRIGRALDQDIEAGGPNATDISRGMWDARPTTPLTPVDTGGENVSKLAGRAIRTPGPGRQYGVNFLDTRDLGANQRLTDLADSLVPGSSSYRTGKALEDAADTASTPAYDAFRAATPMSPDAIAPGGALTQLFQRPTIKAALKGALSNIADEGGDPTSLGINFDADGNVKFQNVPSWRTMELVKRGVDEELQQYRDDYGRWIGGAKGARSALQAQKDFVQFMDDNNSLYKPARDAFAGPASSGTALDMGTGVFSPGKGAPSVDAINDDLASLSPGDQAFYRLGAKNELMRQMDKLTPGSNEAKLFIGSQDTRNRIRAVFGSDADAFLNAGTAEDTGFKARYDLLKGSPTAGRFAEDISMPGEGFMAKAAPFATGAGAILSGEPWLGFTQLARGVGGLLSRTGMHPEVANQVVRNLLETNPATANQTLSEALARYRGPPPTSAGRMMPTVPMATGLLGQQPSMSYAWKGPPQQPIVSP